MNDIFIIKATRFVDAMIRSDEDNDFYFDTETGALIYLDLNSENNKIEHVLSYVVNKVSNRFFLLPKMTEYEKRKIIEEFVHDKINELEVSEKILNELDTLGYEGCFIEVLQEYSAEYDKWCAFFSEKKRISVVLWLEQISKELPSNEFTYVFEEDLTNYMKREHIVLFKEGQNSHSKEFKDIKAQLLKFSKVYKQVEIINPKPKRGRPPKGKKSSIHETLVIPDMYLSYDNIMREFIYCDSEICEVIPNPFELPKGWKVCSPERALEQSLLFAKAYL